MQTTTGSSTNPQEAKSLGTFADITKGRTWSFLFVFFFFGKFNRSGRDTLCCRKMFVNDIFAQSRT